MAFPEPDSDRARTQTQISLTPTLMLLTTRLNYRHLKPRHPWVPVLQGSCDARFLPPSPRSPSETLTEHWLRGARWPLVCLSQTEKGYQHAFVFISKGIYFSMFCLFSCWLHLHMRAGLNPFEHRGNVTSTSLFPSVSHPCTAPPPLYMPTTTPSSSSRINPSFSA